MGLIPVPLGHVIPNGPNAFATEQQGIAYVSDWAVNVIKPGTDSRYCLLYVDGQGDPLTVLLHIDTLARMVSAEMGRS